MKPHLGSAAILTAALLSAPASAATVDWRGGLVITSVDSATCLDLLGAGRLRAYTARYRHPGLGDNGTDTKFSFFNYQYGFNIRKAGGTFLLKTWDTLAGESIGAGASAPYKPIVNITQMIPDPATITDTTPQITIQGTIKRFSGFPGYQNCTISFQAVLFNP